MDDQEAEFEVSFISAGEKIEQPNAWTAVDLHEFCAVKFGLVRGQQKCVFTIFVERDAYSADDYIRVAKHKLHRDLQRLADQTADYELPPEDLREERTPV